MQPCIFASADFVCTILDRSRQRFSVVVRKVWPMNDVKMWITKKKGRLRITELVHRAIDAIEIEPTSEGLDVVVVLIVSLGHR